MTHNNSQRWRQSPYKRGLLHGKVTHWYPNGKKAYEATYKAGEREGGHQRESGGKGSSIHADTIGRPFIDVTPLRGRSTPKEL